MIASSTKKLRDGVRAALYVVLAAAALLACGGSHGRGHAGSHPGARAGAHDGTWHRHGFADAEGFAEIFDDPQRDAWQRPTDVVALLEPHVRVMPGAPGFR